jgi:hypothetical protein
MSEVTVATILRASTRALMGKNRDYLRVVAAIPQPPPLPSAGPGVRAQPGGRAVE